MAKAVFFPFPGFRDRMNRAIAEPAAEDELRKAVLRLKEEILNTRQVPRGGSAPARLRVVIDMQPAQTGPHVPETVELVKSVLAKKSADAELFLVLDGAFPESVRELLGTMAPYIDRAHIKTFLSDWNGSGRADRGPRGSEIETLLREWFFRQFDADVIWRPEVSADGGHTPGGEQCRAGGADRTDCAGSAEKIWALFAEKAEKRRENAPARCGKQQLIADIERLLPSAAVKDIFSALKTVSENLLFCAPRRLYVDLSETIRQPFCTGIQRVANSIAQKLDAMDAADFECTPCYSRPEIEAVFPARWDGKKFQAGGAETPDRAIYFRDRDILLIADIQYENQRAERRFYEQLVDRGVLVVNIVFDLLPVDHPECFPENVKPVFSGWLDDTCRGSGVVGISRHTMKRYREWLSENRSDAVSPYFRTAYFHLGADFTRSKCCTASNVSGIDPELMERLGKIPTFLVVSTLEPRKCHEQILDAFTLLWRDGADVNLVFVGRDGWSNSHIRDKINAHPLLGKCFFWLQGVSDAALESVYSASACVIFASVDEGFGLAIIEGAYYHKHLLLRDIEVFREIAGDSATYFSGYSAEDLAEAVRKWLDVYSHAPGTLPDPSGVHILSWGESAECLLDELRDF